MTESTVSPMRATVVRSLNTRARDSNKWDYAIYCHRCASHVYGERVVSWASKAPAVKRAEKHIERHRRADAAWELRMRSGTEEPVETIWV